MKQLHIWGFCISVFLIQWDLSAQNTVSPTLANATIDSLEVKPKPPMSLRFGADIFRLVRSQYEDDYSGFEVVADFRISPNFYLATEFGNEVLTKQSEQVNFTTEGSYYKIGFDLNMFENWQGMDNQVILGLRLASSSHSQFLNAYTLLDRTPFWQNPEDQITSGFATGARSDLNALWFEVIAGFKVELISNIYLGLSLRLNRLLNDTVPENFENIHIPGFNKKTEDNNFSAGFNYSLSYRIPFRAQKN